jgi:hypothetical protein
MEVSMKIRLLLFALISVMFFNVANAANLEKDFINPPDTARPWVYWINMDGHFTKWNQPSDKCSL